MRDRQIQQLRSQRADGPAVGHHHHGAAVKNIGFHQLVDHFVRPAGHLHARFCSGWRPLWVVSPIRALAWVVAVDFLVARPRPFPQVRFAQACICFDANSPKLTQQFRRMLSSLEVAGVHRSYVPICNFSCRCGGLSDAYVRQLGIQLSLHPSGGVIGGFAVPHQNYSSLCHGFSAFPVPKVAGLRARRYRE